MVVDAVVVVCRREAFPPRTERIHGDMLAR